jgi:hypothetical protein
MAGRAAPDGLAPGPAFEDGFVLVVAAEPPGPFVSRVLGFYPREYAGPVTWRWMGESGSLKVVNQDEQPVTAVLELELQAFPGDRRVEWLLDGRRLRELEVVAEWRRYEIPLGALARGESTLTLACRGAAVVANDIRRNRDARALCLALGSWKVERPASLPVGERPVTASSRARP